MLALLTRLSALAGSAADSIAAPPGVKLGEVEVSANSAANPRVSSEGVTRFSSEALRLTPRTLGETDLLRFMHLLPGVNTISDYSSGSSIDGMSYSQNSYSINGIPIHFPYHFGGIFSVMNPRIYRNAELAGSSRPAASYEALGGNVDIRSSLSPADKTRGELSAGLLSSSLHLAAPLVRNRLSMEIASRISYINALYKPFLRMHQSQALYDFADLDAAVVYTPTESSTLRATTHYNIDRVSFNDAVYTLLTSMRWHNTAAALEWHLNRPSFSTSHRAYFTRFANRLNLCMASVNLFAPTSISEWGLEGSANANPGPVALSGGYAARCYSITPQGAELSGFGSGSHSTPSGRRSTLLKAWGAAKYASGPWTVNAELFLGWFDGSGGYRTFTPDPRITLSRRVSRGAVSLHAGRYHQYIHQVGFSDMGMSSNFKIGASEEIPAQESWNFTLTGNLHPANWLSLNADLYYKRVFQDPEYTGAVLDIVDPSYICERFITRTNGYTWGINLMARVEISRLWAMASYGYGVGKRRNYHSFIYRNALSDLRHALNLSASYVLNKHWNLSATFGFTSGRRITPVTAIYFIADRLIMEYGERNSARLPAWHRLDLGATYSFHSSGRIPLTHEINFSLLNAYGHENAEMSSFRLNTDTGMYERRIVGSLFRFLPSLSYTIRI